MKAFKFLIFLFGFAGYSQAVSVSQDSSTNLVNLLLDNSCTEVSNIEVSSSQAVAYFNNNGGGFPLAEGVIIRSGDAGLSEGGYSGNNLSSEINTNGDPYLEALNNSSGQSTVITDVNFLEFDFIPVTPDFNFNFLFASNEYGEWQCTSSDVLAFVLTDLSTGSTENMAIIPGTQTPVAVWSIKDRKFNPTCPSSNPGFFSTYNVNNPGASTVNMRGYTKVMNASAEVIPGNSYNIRILIGDSNDSNFDSAVFLAGNSFDTNVNLGLDQTLCEGDGYLLETGVDPTLYDHEWRFNSNLIPGETSSQLLVDQAGTYEVFLTRTGLSCQITDKVVVSQLNVKEPQDLVACFNESNSYTFDLTNNNATALGINGSKYRITYYESQIDVSTNNPIPNNQLTAFQTSGAQTIYLKITNTETGNTCNAEYDFDLVINDPIPASRPTPVEQCLTAGNQVVNLNQVRGQILGGADPGRYTVSFYESETNARNNQQRITDPTNYVVTDPSTVTNIWARIVDNSRPNCFDVVDFEIIINELPPVDSFSNVVECSSYTLPSLINGNYFTAPNGGGTPLFAGNTITNSQRIYIFNGPDNNDCTNQNSFKVDLLNEVNPEGQYCGEFIIPTVPGGAFYTEPGGPGGTGDLLPQGRVLTEDQTIYYYAEIQGTFCRDEEFFIDILPLPPVDQPEDVITCFDYTLPALTDGEYYTATQGGGTRLSEGTVIRSTTTLFVFNDDGTCTNEHRFTIFRTPTFQDIDVCGSYRLPTLQVGGFFTEANGQGSQFPVRALITSSQTIFYYAQTTISPNCTEGQSFSVIIRPIPPVDDPDDVLRCENEPYELPRLTNGSYFTEPNRGGIELNAGEIISESITLYVNNLVDGCSDENQFNIEIRPLLEIENFTDIYSCEPFELPELELGSFYTEPGGHGELLAAGTIIDSTRTLYIYRDYDDFQSCFSEDEFTIFILGITVEEFDDVNVCDSFTLPELEKGNYFTESDGKGTQFNPGDELTVSQEIFIYATNGDRFVCTAESSFNVTISQTPQFTPFPDMEHCGSYSLPDLSTADFQLNYYRQSGKTDLITESTISQPGTYTIYAYAESRSNANCFIEDVFELTIYPRLEFTVEGGTICRDAESGELQASLVLNSELDPDEFTVNWYLNNSLVHSGPSHEATVAGVYEVITEKVKPEIGADCNYKPTTVTVYESAAPIIKTVVTEPFEEVAVVRVEIISGFGDYEFSLDNGPFQSNPEFYDVSSGTHLITVRGVTGNCGVTSREVLVIKYPKYFTPNSDGYHDTWNIFDLRDYPGAEIRIFDRFGKLITTLSPSGKGWDGTFNSRNLPSTDYWFMVTFEEDGVLREFKAHFTLKR